MRWPSGFPTVLARPAQSETIRSPFPAHYIGLVGCLAALVPASEAGAGALFPLPTSFATGNRPVSVAVADLDGDTVPDLVTANFGGDDVSVLLGNADGTFQAAVSFPAGDSPPSVYPLSVAVADLDGDSVPDLVIANRNNRDVSVLLGNGDGSFQAFVSFAAGSYPYSVAVADLDGDTLPDLVTANPEAEYVFPGSVLLGNGDGTFQAALSFAAGKYRYSVAVADLDGDTVPDLVTANLGSDDVSVLLGNGDGTFQGVLTFAAGVRPISVVVADLDGDTVPDLVTANSVSDDVSVLLGNGDGTFQAAHSFAAGDAPRSVAVADLDGDTLPDLVTANLFSDDVSVLLGNGDGTFRASVSFAAGAGPRSVAVADLDGNTVPDVVTANFGSDDVTVLFNPCERAAGPEIDVKPGSDLNPINATSRGVIPVAILGSDRFDVAAVDATTLAFGPEAAAPTHRQGGHLEDVNDDGRADLVSHYRTQETGILLGDTEACLTGETHDGRPIQGCDTVLVLGPCGLGFELAFLLPPLLWLHRRRQTGTGSCRLRVSRRSLRRHAARATGRAARVH